MKGSHIFKIVFLFGFVFSIFGLALDQVAAEIYYSTEVFVRTGWYSCVFGWGWPSDSALRVTVDDDAEFGLPHLFDDYVEVVPFEEDPSQGSFYVDTNIELQPGFYVRVTNGTYTEIVEIFDITFDAPNLETQTISGTGPAGSRARIDLMTDLGEYNININEIPLDGQWDAYYGDMIGLEESLISTWLYVFDDKGNGTMAQPKYIPMPPRGNPELIAYSLAPGEVDVVDYSIEGWTNPGETSRIDIIDSNNVIIDSIFYLSDETPSMLWTGSLKTPIAAGMKLVFSPYDHETGTINADLSSEPFTVSEITVIPDYETNTLSGTTSTSKLNVTVYNPPGIWGQEDYGLEDLDGAWSQEFSTSFSEELFYEAVAANTIFAIWPYEIFVLHPEEAIKVTGINPDTPVEFRLDGVLVCDIYSDSIGEAFCEMGMQTSQEVTVTIGPFASTNETFSTTFELRDLTFDSVDFATGIASGTGTPGDQLSLNIYNQEDCYAKTTVDLFGNWSVDFKDLLGETLAPNFFARVLFMGENFYIHHFATINYVGPTGGTLTSLDGSVEVTIPSGALTENTPLYIKEIGEAFTLTLDLGEATAIYSVEIGPAGTEFAEDITIIMSWEDADNDGIVDTTGQDEDYLVISKDGMVKTNLCKDDPDCDTDLNTFSVEVSSLGEYTLGALSEPEIVELNVPMSPVQLGNIVEVSATFLDVDTWDTHTATWNWGDGIESDGVVIGYAITGTHVYDEPGVYTVSVNVTDGDYSDTETFEFVVVYDSEGGFVTGGGWIYSPEGAYTPDTTLEGKATFGFVSKYKKGANVPTGNTEFQFTAADLSFHSSSYDWLLVTGSVYARFKGTGTINGEGEYKFMIWAGDGETDTFRIKIWEEDEFGVETVIYDNGFDQTITGGNIVIHDN